MTIKAHKWLIIVELNILTMACLHLKYSFIRFFPLGVCYYTLYFVACSSKLTLNCAHTHCTGSQKSNNSNPSVSAVIKPLRELVSCHNWGGGAMYICMYVPTKSDDCTESFSSCSLLLKPCYLSAHMPQFVCIMYIVCHKHSRRHQLTITY